MESKNMCQCPRCQRFLATFPVDQITYGLSELEVKRFSVTDLQYVLNENRSLKMEVENLKSRLAKLEGLNNGNSRS